MNAPAQPRDELALLSSLFVAYPDALLLVDEKGRIARSNPAASQLLGYSAEELLGMSVDALVPDAARARHAEYRQGYARTPRPRPMGLQTNLSARRKDGSEVMVEIALSPLQEQAQRFVVAAIRDVTQYPRVQQALQRARYAEHLAQLGRLAVDARDPQVVLDQVPAIAAGALHADAAMVYLLDRHDLDFRLVSGVGLLPGDALGMHLPDRPDSLPSLVLTQAHAVALPQPGLDLPTHCRETGMQAMLAAPLSDRGRGIGALIVCSRGSLRFGDDELRFIESLASLLATSLQRAQSEVALEHAQRLESVGQLTGGIAHDFNNLLTVIQGNLQVLEDLPSIAADPHAPQLVAAAARASRRGAELTSKLLAFSRRQVLQPSTLNVGQLLHSLADMLRRTLDQRIRIEVDAPDDGPEVLADPGQLESALLNIAINARDAMPDGGHLRFSARPLATLPATLPHGLEEPDLAPQGFVAIAVSDTGQGMPEAIKQRAFEPFFTTKEVGRGTGLGLSTVYGFVRQSKGALALDSAPGAGTTLTLYLPQPSARPPADAPAAEAPRALPSGLRVLLVEDDAEVREVVRHFLATLGCEVTPLASGEQALLALVPGVAFDLLVSDIALGAGMRGTELAQLAQYRQPGLKILLMSGYSAELLEADAQSPQGWELLGKPFSREALAESLGRLLALRPADR